MKKLTNCCILNAALTSNYKSGFSLPQLRNEDRSCLLLTQELQRAFIYCFQHYRDKEPVKYFVHKVCVDVCPTPSSYLYKTDLKAFAYVDGEHSCRPEEPLGVAFRTISEGKTTNI